MKNLLIALSVLLLAGCTIGNGHICGPQTPAAYCDKEAYEALMHPKPYGAHWVKDGMTRESRLDDIVACGATRDLTIHFPIESIKKLPGYQYTETDEIRRAASNDVLEDRWRICMKSKGYSYVDKCDIRCL